MKTFLRSLLHSVLAGAATGFVVLGIGGRTMMRIIAHWEGRVPVLTLSGAFTVVMIGDRRRHCSRIDSRPPAAIRQPEAA
jgi:hypothetical protein